jgi:hypothetical protein
MKNIIIFWDITLCSPLSVNRRFGWTYRLHLQGRKIISASRWQLLACWFLAELISSTLKMEAICSSETSVNTQRITRRYIPEDDTLHNVLNVSSARTLGSWVRIPLEAWISLCVCCVFVLSCVGSGLATGSSPVQGVVPTACKLHCFRLIPNIDRS